MLNTILGSKLKMGQAFVEGVRTPVTYVLAGPCVVAQVKKIDKDGYWAVQIGFGQKKIKNMTKPMLGHLKKTLTEKYAPRFIREVKFKEEPQYNVGDIIKISDIFAVGDTLSAKGVSKGKGFAGGVKRWGFSGGPKTHGQSDRQRAPGSIGQGTTPGRVYKGKHMAGRMGSDVVTVKNLKVVSIDEDKNEIGVRGALPGRKETLLILKRLNERKAANA